jgi:hypothetical protein
MRKKRSKLLKKIVISNNEELFSLLLREYGDKVANFTYRSMYRAAKKLWKHPSYRKEMKQLEIKKGRVLNERIIS